MLFSSFIFIVTSYDIFQKAADRLVVILSMSHDKSVQAVHIT